MFDVGNSAIFRDCPEWALIRVIVVLEISKPRPSLVWECSVEEEGE